ncbi:hypothetical protein [Pseudomonas kurunegalensis]|uniref:hypothetical protein n=1 Tax=Pseudomonas kurunegalensis TaxID=485880 RepID=UPI0023633A77|nr:hypothetical protein [Pseudomonas kurunegalensis]MDD2136387.1 hypothetical protein [Pseudomonas kurunegalensis]
MPEAMFSYRLLFLLVFMASIVTWVFLWLAGYFPSRHSARGYAAKADSLTLLALGLVLSCAALDYGRLLERNTLLLAMLCVGLLFPWGAFFIHKVCVAVRRRMLSSHY